MQVLLDVLNAIATATELSHSLITTGKDIYWLVQPTRPIARHSRDSQTNRMLLICRVTMQRDTNNSSIKLWIELIKSYDTQ